jgi:hypothetical protein
MAQSLRENTHSSMERGMGIMNYVQDFVHKRIISAVRRVELLVTGCLT